MWFGVVSILEEIVRAGCAGGVFGRAVTQGLIALEVFDPRAHTLDRHQTVDDRPYGGGPGMVMMVEPLLAAIDEARSRGSAAGYQPGLIYLTPQGERLDQRLVAELAQEPGLILVCGRYEGVDARLLRRAPGREISIGDYVLSGGELPALVLMDAVARLLPGTLGNAASAIEESHLDGLLDYPHYTRPELAGGLPVPTVLTSGDHAAIGRWRLKQALKGTWLKRPDLLTGRTLSELERELLEELFAEGLDHQTGPASHAGSRPDVDGPA
jgi:tRNA (guanine37-N1)-methyltransferase